MRRRYFYIIITIIWLSLILEGISKFVENKELHNMFKESDPAWPDFSSLSYSMMVLITIGRILFWGTFSTAILYSIMPLESNAESVFRNLPEEE
jgi:uncharacterized membrane protein